MTERAARTGGATEYRNRLGIVGIIWLAGLAWSDWAPFDRATWWMEVAPVLVVYPALVALRHRFRLSDLALVLIALHGLVLMLGGAYSYARVPAGFAVQEWLDLTRNPYDRFGHFMQGFVPAIVLRELLVRFRVFGSPVLMAISLLAYCLAISALYELVEFAAAMMLGQGADAFLGTQGDSWDTQWDMLMCLIGAAVALITLSRMHDHSLDRQTLQ